MPKKTSPEPMLQKAFDCSRCGGRIEVYLYDRDIDHDCIASLTYKIEELRNELEDIKMKLSLGAL